MSWTSALSDATAIRKVYSGDPPGLYQVHLHEVSLLRDGPQALIRFDLPAFPADPPVKWSKQGFNVIQLELALVGVQDVSLQGFSADPVVDVELTRPGPTRIDIRSDHFEFHASGAFAHIAKVSAYADGSR